jgi:hypothetical protein
MVIAREEIWHIFYISILALEESVLALASSLENSWRRGSRYILPIPLLTGMSDGIPFPTWTN